MLCVVTQFALLKKLKQKRDKKENYKKIKFNIIKFTMIKENLDEATLIDLAVEFIFEC